MRFIDLKLKLKNNIVIDVRNIINLFGSIDRRRLYEWQKKGYIKKITSNYYVFSDLDINDNILRIIANTIYRPSYIGLESALSFWNVIPEAVFKITSITSRKTKNVKTKIADFNYRSIHKRLFWGYKLIRSTGSDYFISDLEKTILDYLYLNSGINNKDDLKELRFNEQTMHDSLKPDKLNTYLTIFNNKRLLKTTTELMRFLDVKF
jgi:predicted transcriptional regulator of viral defense system